jgi:hypothetical protein
MSGTDDAGRPEAAVAVAEQYLDLARPANAVVAGLAVVTFVGTYLATSLLPAVVVAAVLVVVARVPVLRSYGTATLTTEKPPETVLEEFSGPTPPVLVFQWGAADEVTVDEDGTVSYPISSFFGLRTAVATVARETTETEAGHRVELTVTVGGSPWATYTATITEAEAESNIEVEYQSERRFGLRRVPQQRAAATYRDRALDAQGYTVVARDSHLGF